MSKKLVALLTNNDDDIYCFRKELIEGDVITMQAGCRHTIISDTEEIRLIEVQLGKSISVHDKKKYALEE